MARSALTISEVDVNGAEVSAVACNADGNSIPAQSDIWLMFENGSGGSLTATFVATGYKGGVAIEDIDLVMAAGEIHFITGLEPSVFQQSDGVIHIDYSGVTDLTVKAFKRG